MHCCCWFLVNFNWWDANAVRRSPQVQAFSTGGNIEENATNSNSRSAEILLSSSRNTSVEKIERNNLPAFGNFIGRSRMIRSTMFSMQIEWEANSLRFKILWNERNCWVIAAMSILKRKKGTNHIAAEKIERFTSFWKLHRQVEDD